MTLSEIFNLVLALLTLVAGGGWLFDRRRHREEVRHLRADAEAKEFDVSKMYVEEFRDNIVKPLKEELTETKESLRAAKGERNSLKTEIDNLRKEMTSLKRQVKKLTDAVKEINNCPHAADCPVTGRLQGVGEDGDA